MLLQMILSHVHISLNTAERGTETPQLIPSRINLQGRNVTPAFSTKMLKIKSKPSEFSSSTGLIMERTSMPRVRSSFHNQITTSYLKKKKLAAVSKLERTSVDYTVGAREGGRI